MKTDTPITDELDDKVSPDTLGTGEWRDAYFQMLIHAKDMERKVIDGGWAGHNEVIRRKALLEAIALIRPQPGPEPRDYTAWHEARRAQEWCVKRIEELLP